MGNSAGLPQQTFRTVRGSIFKDRNGFLMKQMSQAAFQQPALPGSRGTPSLGTLAGAVQGPGDVPAGTNGLLGLCSLAGWSTEALFPLKKATSLALGLSQGVRANRWLLETS